MNPQRDWHSEPEQTGFTQRNEKIEIGQPDPALQQEERASGGRIAVYAVGAIVILGILFYGLNRPEPENVAVQEGTPSTASAPSQQPAPSQDEASKGSGTSATTGAAPQGGKDQPQQPQANPSSQPAQGNSQPQKAQ